VTATSGADLNGYEPPRVEDLGTLETITGASKANPGSQEGINAKSA